MVGYHFKQMLFSAETAIKGSHACNCFCGSISKIAQSTDDSMTFTVSFFSFASLTSIWATFLNMLRNPRIHRLAELDVWYLTFTASILLVPTHCSASRNKIK